MQPDAPSRRGRHVGLSSYAEVLLDIEEFFLIFVEKPRSSSIFSSFSLDVTGLRQA
jgi:hypothetical protein